MNTSGAYEFNKPKWIPWIIRQKVLRVKLRARAETNESLSHRPMRYGLMEGWSECTVHISLYVPLTV